MQILRLRAARGRSVAQTAERFLLTEMTIENWMRRLDDEGEAALVRLEQCQGPGYQVHPQTG